MLGFGPLCQADIFLVFYDLSDWQIYFSSLLAFLTDLVDHPYDVLSTVTITFVLFPSIYCCSSALPIVLISQLHKCFWLVLLKRHHI